MKVAAPGRGMVGPGNAHYYYGQYYAVQAMYLAGGEWWAQWWPGVRQELLVRQSADGLWVDVDASDKAGATAERFAAKYGNTEARDVLKERARVLELVAWHREAVREAAANALSSNGRNTATAVGRLALLPHASVSTTARPHWPSCWWW